MKRLKLYLSDLLVAGSQFIFVWFHSKPIIERRLKFLNDGFKDSHRKDELPFKMITLLYEYRLSIKKYNKSMKHRNYFIMFCGGIAFAVSLTSIKMAVFNYLIYLVPLVILSLLYFIAIWRDTSK